MRLYAYCFRTYFLKIYYNNAMMLKTDSSKRYIDTRFGSKIIRIRQKFSILKVGLR